jgi:hypothetical protein
MAFRRFELCRHADVSGISGTGRVAEGIQFSSGTCVIEWLSRTPSMGIFDSVEDLLAVHGHDGATELIWLDEDKAQAAGPLPQRGPRPCDGQAS